MSESTLAVRAANAETAIRGSLRSEFDRWVLTALRQGIEACDELIGGLVAAPNVVSFLTHPETHEALEFVRQRFSGQSISEQRSAMEQIREDLESLLADVEAGGLAATAPWRTRLPVHGAFFQELSRKLSREEELADRLAIGG